MWQTKHLSYWYIIPPVLTFILVLPLVSSLPPLATKGIENPNLFQFLIVVPFYFGLAAAPGYFYAWAGQRNAQKVGPTVRMWIRVSLIVAVVSSLAGGILSLATVIVAPFAFGSLIAAVKLWIRFQRDCEVGK